MVRLRIKRFVPVFFAGICSMLTGCLSDFFAPKADMAKFYILDSVAQKQKYDIKDKVVLSPVILSGYLDRPQITTLDGEIADREAQRELAVTAKSKCSDMTPANDEVKQGFANLGTEANNSVEVPDCETAAKQLCSANEGHINEAVSAAQALIDKLDGEIADLRSQRALAVEGRDYSNGRAEMYRGYAASTRTAIANYSED